MSGGSSSSSSTNISEGHQTSNPLTGEDLKGYFYALNDMTGASPTKGGRLSDLAWYGTPKTDYNAVNADLTYKPVSNDQIKNLGGAGATRTLNADRNFQTTMDQTLADPRLSVFQGAYAKQLAGREHQDNTDAIAKEAEAALTGAALAQASQDMSGRQAQGSFNADQAAKVYQANLANNALSKEDLAMLAQIFFAGKGQTSKSDQWSAGYQSMNESHGGV
jgi:hypothetical protein